MTATVGSAVTFAPAQWNSTKTVQVNGIDTGNTRITHAVTSTDSAYAALTPDPVDVTVAATARVRASTGAITAIEHGPVVSYDVWLNTDPGQSVTVTPQTTSGAITLSGALTFDSTNFRMKQQVTVSANPDTNAVSESATISHQVSGYPGVGSGPQVGVTVRDAGSSIQLSDRSLDVREGESVTYNLTATTEPTDPVFVSVGVQGGNVTVTPSLVQFGDDIGDTPSLTQQVTVQGVSAGAATLTHNVSSTDPSYQGVSVPSVGCW